MTSNRAAWLTAAKANPLTVDEAPFPKPGADEVVVKNKAVAVNPVDWKVQDSGAYVSKYPNVLGEDIAGEIVEVGSEVKTFKKGDRVIAHTLGLLTTKPENGGFQLYTAVSALLTSPLPPANSFAEGAVLPLAISTAAAGLYQSGYLELPFPTINPKDSGKVILVWGASSSVGATAVQLAVASGVTVIATASKHNHAFAKTVGASEVVDYNSSSVVEDVVKAVKSSGKEFAGIYDSISLPESFKPIFEILEKIGGSKKIATVLPPPQDIASDIDAKGVFAVSVALQFKNVGEAVWGDYVPKALLDGSLKFLPEPLVIGQGLESIQKGFDKQKTGVSAKKVVIEL